VFCSSDGTWLAQKTPGPGKRHFLGARANFLCPLVGPPYLAPDRCERAGGPPTTLARELYSFSEGGFSVGYPAAGVSPSGGRICGGLELGVKARCGPLDPNLAHVAAVLGGGPFAAGDFPVVGAGFAGPVGWPILTLGRGSTVGSWVACWAVKLFRGAGALAMWMEAADRSKYPDGPRRIGAFAEPPER